MDTTTLTLLLDELATLLVLETKLKKDLRTLPASTRLNRLTREHSLFITRLKRLIHAYERFTKPGRYTL